MLCKDRVYRTEILLRALTFSTLCRCWLPLRERVRKLYDRRCDASPAGGRLCQQYATTVDKEISPCKVSLSAAAFTDF